jgi:hypothetical protein
MIFRLLFVTDPPRGRPFGGGGTHRNILEEENDLTRVSKS